MRFRFRGFISLWLALMFLVMAYSGVILYATPRGGAASWVSRFAFGLKKPGWEAVHINVSLVFLIVAVLHVIFNWDLLWGYIKKACGVGWAMKSEMVIAVVLAAVVVTGTVYQVPPFSLIRGYGERRGPPEGRGPGFERGSGQGEDDRPGGFGQGQGQGRQFRGGRGGGNQGN
jgi:hypothetical protein